MGGGRGGGRGVSKESKRATGRQRGDSHQDCVPDETKLAASANYLASEKPSLDSASQLQRRHMSRGALSRADARLNRCVECKFSCVRNAVALKTRGPAPMPPLDRARAVVFPLGQSRCAAAHAAPPSLQCVQRARYVPGGRPVERAQRISVQSVHPLAQKQHPVSLFSACCFR